METSGVNDQNLYIIGALVHWCVDAYRGPDNPSCYFQGRYDFDSHGLVRKRPCPG